MKRLCTVAFESRNLVLCSYQVSAPCVFWSKFSTISYSRQRHITKRQSEETLLNKKTQLTSQSQTLNPHTQAAIVDDIVVLPKQPLKNEHLNDILKEYRKQQALEIDNASKTWTDTIRKEDSDGHIREVSICLRDIDSIVTLIRRPRTGSPQVAPETESVGPRVATLDEILWPTVSLDKLIKLYARLAKLRLSAMVVITAAAGYAVAPGVLELSALASCAIGTSLQSAAANSINQILEVPYDSQMNRTKYRPLVQGHLSPLHAALFAGTTCVLGTGILLLGTNLLTAGLGLFNVVLYTAAYTPMKRLSIANTWVGAVVGAVPPLMGWAACTGTLAPGAFVLAAILYAWQFPHFNSLSWNLRPDYSRAGYRMTSVIDPDLCRRVALRYSIGIIGVCTAAPLLDVTTWTFAVDTLPVNLYVTYLAWKFYKQADSKTSRKLFHASLAHVPILLILLLLGKKRYESNSITPPSDQLAAAVN